MVRWCNEKEQLCQVVNGAVRVYEEVMCGRFALGIPKKRLEAVFGSPPPEEYVPRYNVAPGQDILVVTPTGMTLRRWGLVSPWADTPSVGFTMINARSETVFDKPAFREGVRSGRCLVPAQAFYEWQGSASGKQPYAIGLAGSDLFAMAGITARRQDRITGEGVDSVAVLTCPANTLMKTIHHRMPVILEPESWDTWLDQALVGGAALRGLLAPHASAAMTAWPVSTAVNTVDRDGRDLLNRVEVLRQGRLF